MAMAILPLARVESLSVTVGTDAVPVLGSVPDRVFAMFSNMGTTALTLTPSFRDGGVGALFLAVGASPVMLHVSDSGPLPGVSWGVVSSAAGGELGVTYATLI